MKSKAVLKFVLVLSALMPAGAFGQTREQMIDYLMRYSYRKSCSAGSSVSAEIAKLPIDQCIDYLVKSRGATFRERTAKFSDEEVKKTYIEYGGR